MELIVNNIREKGVFLARICQSVTRNSIYALVFLIPLFFLPWSSGLVDFEKQVLLVLLSFVALFCAILKMLLLSSFEFRMHRLHIAIGVFFFSYALSTIFSVARQGSFWGWPYPVSTSLLSILCLCILYVLASNFFSQKEIAASFFLLVLSASIAQLYGIFQLLGWYLIPFSFAKNTIFNTVGSVGSLGFLASVLLPISMTMIIAQRRWARYAGIGSTVLSFLTLVLVNHRFAWIVALIACSLMIIFWCLKRNIFDGRRMFLPVFFLVMSCFFLVANPQLRWLPQKPLEVLLSNRANADIDTKSLKSFPGGTIIGSGPSTFLYDFAKHKDKKFNNDLFWNIEFNAGSSRVLTDLATVGMLGVLASALVSMLAIYYGVRHFIAGKPLLVGPRLKKEPGSTDTIEVLKMPLIAGLCAALVAQTVGYFFYNSNISLDFIYFFCIASLAALVFEHKKTYVLKSSSLFMLAINGVLVLALIFGSGIMVLQLQKYIANINYHNGVKAFADGKKNEGISYLKRAANNDKKSDFYFRELAMFSLLDLQGELSYYSQKPLNEQTKNKFKERISDAVGAANIAVSLNGKNVDNWSTKAYVCQNLIGVDAGAEDCAIASYDKAMQLYPSNPYLPLQQGNVYLAKAVLPKEDKQSFLVKAKEKFNKAVELKKDYGLAYLKIALVAREQGNINEELSALADAQKYASNDGQLLLSIGVVYYQDKNFSAAEEQFKKSLSLIPRYSNALYYLGLAYDQQGKKNEAIDAFLKVLELNPENKNVQDIVDNIKNGRPALAGQTVQPPTPIDQEPEAPKKNP